MFQDQLTKIHNKLRTRNLIFKSSCHFYYGVDFLFRSVFIYFVGLASSLSERTYWDLYDVHTLDMHWAYFSSVSLFGFFAYRFALNKSLNNFTRAIPGYIFSMRIISNKSEIILSIITFNLKYHASTHRLFAQGQFGRVFSSIEIHKSKKCKLFLNPLF
jgi:hypothetical protein